MHVEEAKEMAVEEAKGLNQVVEDAKVMACFTFCFVCSGVK